MRMTRARILISLHTPRRTESSLSVFFVEQFHSVFIISIKQKEFLMNNITARVSTIITILLQEKQL